MHYFSFVCGTRTLVITCYNRMQKSNALFGDNLPSSVSFGMAEKRFFLASVTKVCITSAILAVNAEMIE